MDGLSYNRAVIKTVLIDLKILIIKLIITNYKYYLKHQFVNLIIQ